MALGFDTHVPADRRDRIVDDYRLICAEVVRAEFARSGFMRCGGSHDRGDAIADIQVGLLLAPIAEHPQAGRILPQRLVEVEDVAVGVALSQDRDKAKHQPREPVAVGVCPDQAFAG